MVTIPELIPNPIDLLAMPVEDVAPILLRLAKEQRQNGMVTLQHVTNIPLDARRDYGGAMHQRIEPHLSAAWDWLRTNGFLAPAAGLNGSNGWMHVTAKGEESARVDFARLKEAMAFPKDLLHPAIRDKVWLALGRGDLPEAVFFAFRTVEEAVRAKGKYGYGKLDVGTNLMRRAFDKDNGPLSDLEQPEAEREALAHLFAGAIGSYKNPHSHRTVSLTDLREAQEQCLLASHLLSIVDSRNFPRTP